MSVKAPFSKPELPIPATVRPRMKKMDVVDTAHNNEPISKMNAKNMNVRFTLR
jgi:hypothetical protein